MLGQALADRKLITGGSGIALGLPANSGLAPTARALVAGGVTRLITAGGETSGAVVEALAPQSLAIGPEIDPGVPVMRAGPDLVLALKSGNFGAPDFFAKAAALMERGQ
ncbi:nucleotide-binding domain containing protein [Phaeovulum vinaykumarii]|uniref:nucleotide-binding domain containing protein n=1 Tax=Phaeovulum vinaykumarii TaxID=407234 RepID=UPI0038B28E5C